MANIAQMVNVLQAVILTEGDKMVLTPTYHVFDLYKNHHDATLLSTYAETECVGTEEDKVQNITVSSSVDANGVVHITAANLSATEDCPVELTLLGKCGGKASGRILTGGIAAYNDFDCPETVKIQVFEEITEKDGAFCFTLPACSVVEITVK